MKIVFPTHYYIAKRLIDQNGGMGENTPSPDDPVASSDLLGLAKA